MSTPPTPSNHATLASRPADNYVTVLAIYDDPPPPRPKHHPIPNVVSALPHSRSESVMRHSTTTDRNGNGISLAIDSTNGHTSTVFHHSRDKCIEVVSL